MSDGPEELSADTPERLLNKALAAIDAALAPADPYTILSQLRATVPPPPEGQSFPAHMRAEFLAFSFIGNQVESADGLGTYFRPRFTEVSPDGSISPDISQLTPEIIDHWRMRSTLARHPVLRARYADLCWVLGKKVTGGREKVGVARTAIDGYLEAVNSNLCVHPTTAIDYVGRALFLSRSLKDEARLNAAKRATLQLEMRIAEDHKMGLWGFSFELLDDEYRLLSQEEAAAVAKDLELRLSRLTDPTLSDDAVNPHAAEQAAQLLSRYYKKRRRDADAKRVVLASGAAFIRAGRAQTPLVAAAWLQDIHQLYTENGMSDEAAALEIPLAALNEEGMKSMRSISAKVEVPSGEIEEYVSKMTAGTTTEAFERIAVQFLPNRERIEKRLKEATVVAPLSSMLSLSLDDKKGRNVAVVGSWCVVFVGRVVHQMTEEITVEWQFLDLVLEELNERGVLTSEAILEFLFSSAAFTKDREFVLRRGIDALLAEDWLGALHFLIPQIEFSIRTIAKRLGASVSKHRRGGGMLLRTLDELLRESKLGDLLGNDSMLYLRVVLTDQRGLNLRNVICHGDAEEGMFHRAAAQRLLHVLLFLAMVRAASPAPAPSVSSQMPQPSKTHSKRKKRKRK
jgi:hypothetical protein